MQWSRRSTAAISSSEKNRRRLGTQHQAAAVQAGDDANVHYNLGLAYVDLKQYDKALLSAHKAYQLGFPLMGLKNRLQRAGAWREP